MSNASGLLRLGASLAPLIPGVGPVLGAAIAIGGNLAVGAYDARKARRQIEQSKQQRDLSLPMPTVARRRVYGRDRVPGALRYWTTHGPESRFLSMVYVFADHACESIDEIHFDDRSIGPLDASGYVQSGSPWWKAQRELQSQVVTATAGVITLPGVSVTTPGIAIDGVVLRSPADFIWEIVGGQTRVTLLGAYASVTSDIYAEWTIDFGRPLARVRRYLGAVPQTADATLITDSGGEWTSACRLDGQTYAVVTLEWDETVAANGIPTVYALLKGVRVWDPRTSTTAWSDNWALCIRDYLRHASGCADSEIDDATVISSANTADETVTVDGGTIKRYTINGSIDSTTDPVDALQDMALAGGGTVTWGAGKFRILAGAYRSPVSIALTDADLAGGYQYQGEISREDRFNSVVGVFRDARPVSGVALYTRTDYSAYVSSAYIAEDNGETIERRIDLPYITDYRAANRVAKQIMRRARQGARITATWNLKALPLQVGDVVSVTLARPGLVAKPFEVVSTRYQFPGSVELVLQETDPSCYDWSFTEVAFLDPAPNTALPSPTEVATPVLSVLCTAAEPATIKVLADGSQIPFARVSWPTRINSAEYVEIRWKRATETGFRTLTARPGETSIDIEGISGGDVITIVGVAVNGIGARSAPWIVQQYQVDANLPAYNGSNPALSANLLSNTTFELNTAQWTVVTAAVDPAVATFQKPDRSLAIPGTPTNAVLFANDGGTAGKALAAYSQRISVEPNRRVVAYAAVLGAGCKGAVGINFYDASGAGTPGSFSTFSAIDNADPATSFRDAGAHEVISLIATTPPGTASMQLQVLAGAFTARPTKLLSIYRPFLGELPAGATDLPPWDAGGANVVGTELIAPGAATALYEGYRAPGAAAIQGPNDYYAADFPNVVIPASADIEDGTLLRVHVAISLSATGKPTVGSTADLSANVSLIDLPLDARGNLTTMVVGAFSPDAEPRNPGSSYFGIATFAGYAFDQHLSAPRDWAGVALGGSVAYSATFRWVRGYGRRFGLIVQTPLISPYQFDYAITGPARISIEVLKR